MAANLPKIILEAIARVDTLISSAFFRRGRTKGYKAMKSDHAENIKALLITLLKACCMEFEGGLCRVSGDLARPLTVPEMAKFSEKNQRTVERCLADLKDLGLVHSQKQFMRRFPEGLKVAAVWRVLTQLFWEKLGLWDLLVESVKYAAAHAHLRLKYPLKLVGKRKKPYNITEEQRRQSKLNNERAIIAVNCPRFKRAKSCLGGFQASEVCDVCHKLP